MFLNRSQIKVPKDVNCVIPIYGQKKSDSTPPDVENTWFLGKAILSSYYQIFDGRFMDESNGGYLTIGMGPINPIDEVGKEEIRKHDENRQKAKSDSHTAIVVVILIIILIVFIAAVYFCIRFNKRGEHDISIYDDESRKSRKFMGKDSTENEPIGPGECGINNDDS